MISKAHVDPQFLEEGAVLIKNVDLESIRLGVRYGFASSADAKIK